MRWISMLVGKSMFWEYLSVQVCTWGRGGEKRGTVLGMFLSQGIMYQKQVEVNELHYITK